MLPADVIFRRLTFGPVVAGLLLMAMPAMLQADYPVMTAPRLAGPQHPRVAAAMVELDEPASAQGDSIGSRDDFHGSRRDPQSSDLQGSRRDVQSSRRDVQSSRRGWPLSDDPSRHLADRTARSGHLVGNQQQRDQQGRHADHDAANAAGQAGSATDEALDPALAALRDKLHHTLDHYYRRPVDTGRNSPWSVMHAVIGFGADTFVERGGPGGPLVSGVGWLCYNGRCAGQSILHLDGQGRLGVLQGPGVQGHPGQLLAILAQCHIKADYPIRVGNRQFTIADLVEYEKRTCEPNTELTFKLIGLSHYLRASDETWTDQTGRTWDIQRLIREELAQPVRGAACGGTHRMMGFSHAVRKRQQSGLPMVGEFRRAEQFVIDYHRYAFQLQNPDGSFSTEWFNRRSASGGADRRLETSGHIFEWLAFSLSDEELRDPRAIRAAGYLCDLLLAHPDRQWEIGSLGHGLHGLRRYEQRVFGQWQAPREPASAADAVADNGSASSASDQ